MSNSLFPRFLRELREHDAPGYYSISERPSTAAIAAWCRERSLRPPSLSIDFTPVIDLTSPMRVRFAEIKDHL